jgi:uncharacterized alpha-E superfamily protein
MLSRTADSLYWLARYVERAENIARIIETTQRLVMLPSAGSGSEWGTAVETVGVSEAFNKVYPEANRANVVEFLTFSPDNPSSIRSCLSNARTNARAIRTALTSEMWEAINDAWAAFKTFKTVGLNEEELTRTLDFVKETSLRFDGSAYRTMLRNDAYWFSRIGVMIERADNTARLLDVKYHVLLPDSEAVGGSLDFFQWNAILRAVSAATSYHWVYKESLKPWLVADLLLLNEQMPRSIAACYESITRNLDLLANSYGRQGPAQRTARGVRARLQNAKIEAVFQDGLHEFVEDFLNENNKLGQMIAEQYLT